MNSLISVAVCVLFGFLLAPTLAEEGNEPKRSTKLTNYALTPMLRVGRRSPPPGAAWDLKRRLLAFPRLARRDWAAADADANFGPTSKRTNANSGMWFGPRLGRVQKRSAAEERTPWTYIILNGEGPVSRQVHYTPRLGRESDELFDELMDEDTLAA